MDHQTVTMIAFWCNFGFGKFFGASSWSSHWVGQCWLSYKTHFLLHITIWSRNSSLLHRIREDDSSKWQFFFWFSVGSWGTRLLSFFTYSICFKCRMTVDTEFFGNFSCSCKGSTSMILSVGHCQLPMASHSASHLQGSHLLCKTSWTTTALYVHYQLLLLWVVSASLQPILKWSKKINWICFLSNIISLIQNKYKLNSK